MNFGIYDIENNTAFGVPIDSLQELIKMFKEELYGKQVWT